MDMDTGDCARAAGRGMTQGVWMQGADAGSAVGMHARRRSDDQGRRDLATFTERYRRWWWPCHERRRRRVFFEARAYRRLGAVRLRRRKRVGRNRGAPGSSRRGARPVSAVHARHSFLFLTGDNGAQDCARAGRQTRGRARAVWPGWTGDRRGEARRQGQQRPGSSHCPSACAHRTRRPVMPDARHPEPTRCRRVARLCGTIIHAAG